MEVRGLVELTGALISAATTAKPRARAVVEQKTRDVANSMRSRAPVLTGRLRDSIEEEIIETSDGVVGEAGPTVPYARAQEYGTATHAPHPYAGPAADENEADLIKEIEDIGVF